MLAYQFDLFEDDPDEIEILKGICMQTQNMADNVRKGCFKRINDMGKEVIRLKEQNEVLERRLYAVEKVLNLHNTDFSLSVEAVVGLKRK